MKKAVKLFLAGIAAAALLGGTTAAAEDAHVVIKAGHTGNDECSYNQAFLKFAELASEYSEGSIEVEVFSGAQLGGERDMIEGLQMGSVDMCLADSSVWANFVPEYSTLTAFYTIQTAEQAQKVSQSEFADYLTAQTDAQQCHVLTWLFAGSRNVFGTKEWASFDDFKGAKLRTMENAVQQTTFGKMGFIATPMAMSEIVTALQQNTIDCAEMGYATIHQMSWDDVAKYIYNTNHMYSTGIVCVSNRVWDSLSDAQKEALTKAAEETQAFEIDHLNNAEKDVISLMEEKGVKFIDVEVPQSVKDDIHEYYKTLDWYNDEYMQIVLDCCK